MSVNCLGLTGAPIDTIVGSGRSHFYRTHGFNADGTLAFAASPGGALWRARRLFALWLSWRPGKQETEWDLARRIAALLPAVASAPFPSLSSFLGPPRRRELCFDNKGEIHGLVRTRCSYRHWLYCLC